MLCKKREVLYIIQKHHYWSVKFSVYQYIWRTPKPSINYSDKFKKIWLFMCFFSLTLQGSKNRRKYNFEDVTVRTTETLSGHMNQTKLLWSSCIKCVVMNFENIHSNLIFFVSGEGVWPPNPGGRLRHCHKVKII